MDIIRQFFRWIWRNMGTILTAFALAIAVWVSAVVAADPVIYAGGGGFTQVRGGWHRFHAASHLRGGIPRGGNLLYLTGNVRWRQFRDMRVRCHAGPVWFF